MPASNTPPSPDFRNEARRLLRQWISWQESDVLSAVDTLGAQAIGAAAEASARLDRGVAASRSAEKSLETLQALAASLDAPARPARRSFFARNAPPQEPQEDVQTRIEALVQTLDHERDAVARSLITIETDSKKLGAAAEGLDEALLLIQACAAAADAAGRELMRDQPERARFLCETVRARLLAREQDVATQAAVTQQGILTLQLLREGQDALAQALTRARDTSIAALRTALAARRAVAGSQDMARQAEALAQTARAAEATPAGARELQRVLDDAVEQARRAIHAAEAPGRPTPL